MIKDFKNDKIAHAITNLKYISVAWIGCALFLMSVFWGEIQHEKRMDEIFDKYEQAMNELHSDIETGR